MHKTKKQLMDKAIELFREKGYDNVTISEISDACNVTKGSFYHHFKNKSDILISYYAEVHQSILPMLEKMVNVDSAYEKLWEIIKHSVEKNINVIGPELFKEILLAKISDQPDSTNLEKDLYLGTENSNYVHSFIKSIITKGQDEGSIRKNISASDLYFTYRLAEHSSAIKWSKSNGNYDRLEEIKTMFEIIFKPYS